MLLDRVKLLLLCHAPHAAPVLLPAYAQHTLPGHKCSRTYFVIIPIIVIIIVGMVGRVVMKINIGGG